MPIRNRSKRKKIIFLVYATVFAFFIFKMFFYAHFVGRFPDEVAHISYIAYLEQEHKIIPDFKSMTILIPKEKNNDLSAVKDILVSYPGPYIFGESVNYLGHPPLYYQLMRLSGGVKVQNGVASIDIWRLRYFNMVLSAFAMLLIFYIGYSRIRDIPILHLLSATICVSVPMLAYVSAGVNNDNLALLGVSLSVLGLLRFSEHKRTFFTYSLLSIGLYISVMSKLTAGLIVLLAFALYLVFALITEKNLRFLKSKEFLVTLPVYLIAAAYFALVHMQTGSFQPSYRLLDLQGYLASDFYVPPASRTHMDFLQYAKYYIAAFLGTWTGIASNVSLLKDETALYSLPQIGLVGLLVLPLLLSLQLGKNRPERPAALALFAFYLGLIITMIVQFLRAYLEYKNISGYLGGYQSRYYLCGIAAIALATVFAAGNIYGKETGKQGRGPARIIRQMTVQFAAFAFVLLLLYEDFGFFLKHFTDYL